MGSKSTEDKLINGKEFAGARKKDTAYGIVDQQGGDGEETPSFATYKGQQVYGDSLRQFTDSEEETDFDFMREGREQLQFDKDSCYTERRKDMPGIERRSTAIVDTLPGIEQKNTTEIGRPRATTIPEFTSAYVREEIEPTEYLQRTLQDFETQLMKKVCDAVKLQSESMFSKQQRIIDKSFSALEGGMKVKSEEENKQALYWVTREEDLKHNEAVVAQREEGLRMQELRLQEAASAKASVEEKEREVKRREEEVKERESQYQAENNQELYWMTRVEDIKVKEVDLAQREDDLRMKELWLQEAVSVKVSVEEKEHEIKRREDEVKPREPQYQDEDTTLNELSSLKNALLEQKQEMDRKLEQMRVKEAELQEKEKYLRRLATEEELSKERRESEFQERLRNALSRKDLRDDSQIGQTDKETLSNRDIPIKQEMISGKERSKETMAKKIHGDPVPSLIKKSADCSSQKMDTTMEIKIEHVSDGAQGMKTFTQIQQ